MAFAAVALSALGGAFWEYGYLERAGAIVTTKSDAVQALQASLGFLTGGCIAVVLTLVLVRLLRNKRHVAGKAALGGNAVPLVVGIAFLSGWHDPAPAVLVPLALATLGTLSFWLILRTTDVRA